MNQEQHDMLVRIDERVDSLLTVSKDVEVRLRRLERFMNWAAGVVAVIGTALGYNLKPLS